MKQNLKKMATLAMLSFLLLAGCAAVGCSSSRGSKSSNNMYERKQTNKGSKVKSNIKVRGNNKSNGHTTRSY